MKRIRMILGTLVVVLLVCCSAKTTTYAYTDEEKAQAKAWLSANGYSPDAGGAAQAYADYMAGKFGKIDGLPDPEGYVDPAQEEQRKKAEREKAEAEQSKKKDQKAEKENKPEDKTEDKTEDADAAPGQENVTDAMSPAVENPQAGVGTTDEKGKDSTATSSHDEQVTQESENPSPAPSAEASPIELPEVSDKIKEQIQNLPSADQGADGVQDGQAEDAMDMLSPEDMERIRLLAAVAKEAESFEESGKQFGITQKDKMVALILGCVAGVLVIGGVIAGVVLAKKKKQ